MKRMPFEIFELAEGFPVFSAADQPIVEGLAELAYLLGVFSHLLLPPTVGNGLQQSN